MGLFRSPENELEKGGKPVPEEDAGIRTACPHCGVQLPLNDLQDNLQVCTALRVPLPHGAPGQDRVPGGRGQLFRAVWGHEEPGRALLPRL